jgi:hypothetical protein
VRVTVLGAGSWGTTVAFAGGGRNPTVLWARSPDLAAEIDEKHVNASYLPGFDLPEQLHATADLEEAVAEAEPTRRRRCCIGCIQSDRGAGPPRRDQTGRASSASR